MSCCCTKRTERYRSLKFVPKRYRSRKRRAYTGTIHYRQFLSNTVDISLCRAERPRLSTHASPGGTYIKNAPPTQLCDGISGRRHCRPRCSLFATESTQIGTKEVPINTNEDNDFTGMNRLYHTDTKRLAKISIRNVQELAVALRMVARVCNLQPPAWALRPSHIHPLTERATTERHPQQGSTKIYYIALPRTARLRHGSCQ